MELEHPQILETIQLVYVAYVYLHGFHRWIYNQFLDWSICWTIASIFSSMEEIKSEIKLFIIPTAISDLTCVSQLSCGSIYKELFDTLCSHLASSPI